MKVIMELNNVHSINGVETAMKRTNRKIGTDKPKKPRFLSLHL